MTIRCISLHQPFAQGLFTPHHQTREILKRNETRSWALNEECFGEPIAIHASLKKKHIKDWPGRIAYARQIIANPKKFPEQDVHTALGILELANAGHIFTSSFPLGKVIGVVMFTHCLDSTEALKTADPIDVSLGDYKPGRFIWRTQPDRLAFDDPPPRKGLQGFFKWDVPEELEPLVSQFKNKHTRK